jgi:hypothetical protein
MNFKSESKIRNMQKISIGFLLFSILLTFFVLSCKKEEKDNQGGLLLLYLLSRNNSTESTGFFITIPDGVAK